MIHEHNDRSSVAQRGWHHSPAHAYVPGCAYFITAATLHRKHCFTDCRRLALLQAVVLTAFQESRWRLQAWAVFSNHYHCVALAPTTDEGRGLTKLMQRVHSQSARELNALDNAQGRRVWFQYRDTLLTYANSYYARLNYTHNNPVKHGLVAEARSYPYCSAAWFEQHAGAGLYRKIRSFKWDKVNVEDSYEVEWQRD